MRKVIVFIVLSIFVVITLGFIYKIPRLINKEAEQDIPRATVVAENLEIPWSIAFLADGNMLVTERPGAVKLVNKNGKQSRIVEINDVKHFGDAGLSGLVLHPDFAKNQFVYVYYTYSSNDERDLNRVVSFKFDGKTLIKDKLILEAIPGAKWHDGGRMKFGPDGFLYVTTGDAENPSLAQDINSLAGKILRMTDEGEPAPGNPFNNLVYSYGHRNPQGLAWDKDGKLWSTEHGAKGTDELNLIEPGKNYGWPIIRGEVKQEGMMQPIIHSGTGTWAPADAAFINQSIFFGGLRGQALFEAVIGKQPVVLRQHFKNEFGRIREVIVGPDGMLYLTTSNRDSKGTPTSTDDKIIRINPSKL